MAFNNSGNNNNELDQLLMLMQKHKHQHGRLVIRASRGQSNDALDDAIHFAKNFLEDVKELRGVPTPASSQPSPLAASSQPSPLPASSQPSPPRQQEQTSRRNRQKHQCKQEPQDVIVLDMEPDEERHCSEEENRLDDKQASSTAVAPPKDDTSNGGDNNDKPLAKRRRTADIKFDDFLADNNNLRHSKGVTTAVINDHLRDLGLKAPLSKFGISRDGENDVVILQFKNERTSLPFLDEKTGQLTILWHIKQGSRGKGMIDSLVDPISEAIPVFWYQNRYKQPSANRGQDRYYVGHFECEKIAELDPNTHSHLGEPCRALVTLTMTKFDEELRQKLDTLSDVQHLLNGPTKKGGKASAEKEKKKMRVLILDEAPGREGDSTLQHLHPKQGRPKWGSIL